MFVRNWECVAVHARSTPALVAGRELVESPASKSPESRALSTARRGVTFAFHRAPRAPPIGSGWTPRSRRYSTCVMRGVAPPAGDGEGRRLADGCPVFQVEQDAGDGSKEAGGIPPFPPPPPGPDGKEVCPCTVRIEDGHLIIFCVS